MFIVLMAFLGRALTILNPCILPVLLFGFTSSEQSFVKSTALLLVGMALANKFYDAGAQAYAFTFG